MIEYVFIIMFAPNNGAMCNGVWRYDGSRDWPDPEYDDVTRVTGTVTSWEHSKY